MKVVIIRTICVVALAMAAAAVLLEAQGASEADKAFVGKVSQGGMYEVEASKLAMTEAVAPDVLDQATAEVHDHQGVGANLKKAAAATNVAVAGSLNAEFQQRLDKLKATPRGEFDVAYIADMKQIHDKDEKLFAQEAREGSSTYKTFAHQTDMIVKRHIGALNAPGVM
jgi:putative membrane protein